MYQLAIALLTLVALSPVVLITYSIAATHHWTRCYDAADEA